MIQTARRGISTHPPASEFARGVAARVVAAHALEVWAGAVRAERVLLVVVNGDNVGRLATTASVVVVRTGRGLRTIRGVDASGIGDSRCCCRGEQESSGKEDDEFNSGHRVRNLPSWVS